MELDAEQIPANLGAPLLAVMGNEQQLLAELRRGLAQQRAGVARGEPAMLEAASQAVSRAILTLDEVRRRREQLATLASGGQVARLGQLEQWTGPIPGLAEARQALHAEAEAAVRELAETQELLRAAMRAGDAYLQALFASVARRADDLMSESGAPARPASPPGLLLNRTA